MSTFADDKASGKLLSVLASGNREAWK